jgi:tRNA pseudouridine synthase 10
MTCRGVRFDGGDLMTDHPDRAVWQERVAATAADYEFRTFLLGTSLPKGVEAEEAAEAKHALNLAVGLALEEAWPERVVDFGAPDIRFVMVIETGEIRVQSSPLFVYGRYVKDCRNISQTRWHCQACHGRGCAQCDGTGHRYTMTVEEAVGRPLREAAGAPEGRLHGAGREDVDARMLGRGRPFVMTLTEPHRRTIDLEAAAAQTPIVSDGRVSVLDLTLVEKPMVKEVTQARCQKTYRAEVVCGGDIPDDAAARVAHLVPLTLAQQTPTRVLRRRSDVVRYRRILEIDLEITGPRTLTLMLRTEAGTYVKEFVSGDEDRTTPCLSSILGIPALIDKLDVLEVAYEPPLT